MCGQLSDVLYVTVGVPQGSVLCPLLFTTIVLPHFDYCSQVWRNSTRSVLDPIIKLQKRGGRMLIGAPRLTPTKHVFKKLKWTDISIQWQQQKLCMVLKISNGDALEYMLNYFEEVKNLHNHKTWMAASGGYTLPKINNDSGKRTFCYIGAQTRNQLPTHVWKSQQKNSFNTDCVKYI